MLIDFQKAFDSVSIVSIFGFKESFCKWIKVLNTNVIAAVLQRGTLSELFNIERGCRQGDPISAYLFILCAQIMFLLIVNNRRLKGISVNGNEFKITQFADDKTLILDGSKTSLLATLNVLEIYGNISGLKVNMDKTKLIWIGKKHYLKDKIDVGRDLVCGNSKFSLLGINFSVDLTAMIELNYLPVIKSIEKLINLWSHRYLTPTGKIAVIKSLALSKLNHLFLSLPSPGKDIFKELETMFYKFIWSGKPDKVKRKIISKHYFDGGLNMIGLDTFVSAMKITWICRLYNNFEAPWAKVVKLYLGSINKIILLGSGYCQNMARKIKNKFWSETVYCWSNFIQNIPIKDVTDVLSEPLWNNPRISKAQLLLPAWYNNGVISTADLIYANGDYISLNDLKMVYHIKTNFLEYHRVITCVKIHLGKLKDVSKLHKKRQIFQTK